PRAHQRAPRTRRPPGRAPRHHRAALRGRLAAGPLGARNGNGRARRGHPPRRGRRRLRAVRDDPLGALRARVRPGESSMTKTLVPWEVRRALPLRRILLWSSLIVLLAALVGALEQSRE